MEAEKLVALLDHLDALEKDVAALAIPEKKEGTEEPHPFEQRAMTAKGIQQTIAVWRAAVLFKLGPMYVKEIKSRPLPVGRA